ncbi:sulfate/thiosulfate transporter subunit, partial [Salmonella enterica subsp. enterica serovar Infantis]
MLAVSSRRVLPGFTLSLGTSLLFVCLILLLPLSALVMQLSQMSWSQYWDVVTNPQVVAAYKVTLLAAFVASIFNGVFGLHVFIHPGNREFSKNVRFRDHHFKSLGFILFA